MRQKENLGIKLSCHPLVHSLLPVCLLLSTLQIYIPEDLAVLSGKNKEKISFFLLSKLTMIYFSDQK